MSSFHGFAHRPNLDETFDSICRTCFVTVASHVQERNLAQFELRHVCDPALLERFEAFEEVKQLAQRQGYLSG